MKQKDIKSGQTLVTALGLTALLTLTVAAIGVSVMSDRHSTKVNTNRTTSSYALDSAENIANTILRDYMAKKFKNWASNNNISGKTSYFGNNPSEAETFFDDLVSIPSSKREFTLSNNYVSETGFKKSLIPTKYIICYFEDLNSNFTKDSSEKSFEWKGFVKGSEPSTLKSQTGYYDYNFTIYGYTLNGINKNYVKKVNYSGSLSLQTGPESFADYALFTHVFKTPSGGDISFSERTNFTGKVHTNGSYRFVGDSTKGGKSASFKGKVTSFGSSITWNNGGSPKTEDVTGKTNPKNGTKDIPDFQSGFESGVAEIELPPNDISQERATLGGNPSTTTAVTSSEKNTALGTTGTTPPNGVYPAKSGTNLIGGIYVQGNVDQLIMAVDSSGNQTYTFKQGSTNQRITVNSSTNQTSFQNLNSSGTPTGSPTTYSGTPNGSLYVNGKIDFLGGPSRTNSSNPNTSPPAIASNNQLTITAKGDVKIQRDIKYQSDPRTNADAKNTLGIFSTGGDIILGSSSPNNIQIHATLMASSTNKSIRVEGYDSGSTRGDATILGGIIEHSYGAFGTFNSSTGTASSGFGRDFVYDERLTFNPPPFFPTTNKLKEPNSQFKKLVWEEKNL